MANRDVVCQWVEVVLSLMASVGALGGVNGRGSAGEGCGPRQGVGAVSMAIQSEVALIRIRE